MFEIPTNILVKCGPLRWLLKHSNYILRIKEIHKPKRLNKSKQQANINLSTFLKKCSF